LTLLALAAGAGHWAHVEWELRQKLTRPQTPRAVATAQIPETPSAAPPVIVVDWTPPIEVTENAQHYFVRVELSDDDVTTITTELVDNTLKLWGTRLINRGTLSDERIPRSSVSVRFERLLHFPVPLQGPPHASCKKGEFTLTLHKAKQHPYQHITLR
jgi:HSP20 family molecular chaperone IbpA